MRRIDWAQLRDVAPEPERMSRPCLDREGKVFDGAEMIEDATDPVRPAEAARGALRRRERRHVAAGQEDRAGIGPLWWPR